MAISLSPSLWPGEEDDTRGGFEAGVVSSSTSTSDGGDGGGGDGGVACLALGRQQQQDGMSRKGEGLFFCVFERKQPRAMATGGLRLDVNLDVDPGS